MRLFFTKFNRYSFRKYCSIVLYRKDNHAIDSKYIFFNVRIVMNNKIVYCKWFFRYSYAVHTLSGLIYDIIKYYNRKYRIVVFEITTNSGGVYDIYYDAKVKRFSFYNFQLFDYSGINVLDFISCIKRIDGKFKVMLNKKLKLIPINKILTRKKK